MYQNRNNSTEKKPAGSKIAGIYSFAASVALREIGRVLTQAEQRNVLSYFLIDVQKPFAIGLCLSVSGNVVKELIVYLAHFSFCFPGCYKAAFEEEGLRKHLPLTSPLLYQTWLE